MSSTLTLPTLPLGAAEATVVRWLVEPGAHVVRGQPLLILLSEHAEIALPAFESGMLDTQLVAEAARVRVGEPILRMGDAQVQRAPRLSPVAQKIANVHQLQLDGVAGSGPGGVVMKRDLMPLLADDSAAGNEPQDTQTSDQSEPHHVDPLTHILQPPASYFEPMLPFAVTAMEADLGLLQSLVARAASTNGRRPQLGEHAWIAFAIAHTLQRHPMLNGRWSEDGPIVRRRIHLGIEDTLVSDAQDLNARGLARAMFSTARGDEHATFAVAFGGSLWTNMPAGDCASLHVGAVARRAVVVGDDQLVVRPIALLALRYDARMLDQPQADAFLRDLRDTLTRLDEHALV